jgi:hypothetical protein
MNILLSPCSPHPSAKWPILRQPWTHCAECPLERPKLTADWEGGHRRQALQGQMCWPGLGRLVGVGVFCQPADLAFQRLLWSQGPPLSISTEEPCNSKHALSSRSLRSVQTTIQLNAEQGTVSPLANSTFRARSCTPHSHSLHWSSIRFTTLLAKRRQTSTTLLGTAFPNS